MISRSNYEIVFIDYFDGRLDKIREEELFAFLKSNPDLQEEFNLFSGIRTVPDLTINFVEKEKLKKEIITNYNYKTWLVAYLENDINAEQRKEVDFFLSYNSALKPELEILKLTRLVPDSRIIYNKKNELKQGAKIIYFTPALQRVLSVAAVLIFMVIAYFLIHQMNANKSVVADHKEKEQNVNDVNNFPDVKKPAETEKKDQYINHRNKKSGFRKSSTFAANTKTNVEPARINKLKEVQGTLTPENSNLVLLKDSMKVMNNNVKIFSVKSEISFQTKYIQPPSNKLSEIFNKEEMKELGISNVDPEKSKGNNMSLFDLASGELKKISKSSDISLERQKDPLKNSVTYALEVGKSFSISHTAAQ